MTDSKQQILQTALGMFLKNTYKEVSLKDIVNEVGLTKGAFYHYYTSKEELFGEVVKYFYNHAIITNFHNFPQNSLKEFYEYYLKTLQEPDKYDDGHDDVNFFMFLAEAAKKVPDFMEIHLAQRKKELWAWTEIIDIAKNKKEIKSNIPSKELAIMFLNISDGVAINRGYGKKDGYEALAEIRTDWNNLYSLLKTNKK